MSQSEFPTINRAYNCVFRQDRLSVGLVVPIENYASNPVPQMQRHVERVQLAEQLGFSAVWLRDVPYSVPSFGDAGQTFDPFVYLGCLASCTQDIALGVASIILPLRHPAHVAKAAATADVLSDGRLILGIASGDRPEEYPALNVPYADRGVRFRESFDYIRSVTGGPSRFSNAFGTVDESIEMLPRATGGRLPLLITGGSQQNPQWLVSHSDGRMLYPRPALLQQPFIQQWREQLRAAGRSDQPILEPLYIDLVSDPDAPPAPIHLGFRLGANSLVEYLRTRQAIGVNHVALNLRFNQADIEDTLQQLAAAVLPEFHS
ncbi:MAG: LLM class oxidoreductase [Planctomycetaceae bacterium]|nr:LLM class oxidoreductase [Planctomycetaceae bacterium]